MHNNTNSGSEKQPDRSNCVWAKAQFYKTRGKMSSATDSCRKGGFVAELFYVDKEKGYESYV